MELATAFVTIRPDASSFEAELVAAISGIGEQDISVTAETGVAASDMDAFMADYFNLDVDVDADTSAAVAAVESIPDGEVEVTANTEQAEAALDQVKEKVEETTDSTSKLGEAAQGALTGMGGLSGAAGGAANALGASAVAGGAAAVGLFSFAQAAIDAESAGQRFEMIAGSLGPELQTIDVGGLSGDIGDLALQLGSSDEAMLNATASFVTFAESTGASGDEIVRTSENINALALRAVALNPSLGDAGAVADRMTNALARGGRATTQFGIGLTSAEINARAMADTGKQNAAELTQFEKAAAGAAIATERLGQSMGEDFAAGSQNARTEWNRMTESLGEASESMGGVMLPAIENITEAVTEMASGIANLSPADFFAGLWDISGPGLFVNGVTDAWSALSGGAEAISGTGELIGELPPALLGTADAADAAAQSVTDLGQSIDDYLTGLFSVPAAQRDLRQSFSDLAVAMAEGNWDEQAVAMENVVGEHANVIAAMQAQGASQAELDAATYVSIGALAQMRAAGQITGAQFDTLSGQINGVPRTAVTAVTTPGLPESQNRVVTYRGHVVNVPPDWRTNFTANTGSAIGSIQALIDKIGELNRTVIRPQGGGIASQVAAISNGLRNESAAAGADVGRGSVGRSSVSKDFESGAALGAGVGRSSVASVAPAALPPVQVVVDGAVVAEASFEHNRRLAMAEGYES